MLAKLFPEQWSKPMERDGNGSGFGFDSGGGERVIRGTKYLS
jgi:hypothetical protein